MTEKFVTLPREVVEQAMNSLRLGVAMYPNGGTAGLTINEAINALRAALDQPQNHVPEAGNMVPAGWKLVPVEPTRGMIEAGKDAHYEAEKRIQEPDAWKQGGFAKRAVRAAHVFQAMLAAAPQPPTTEQSSVVEQPQGEQEPFAWINPRALEWGTRQSEKVVKLTCKAQPEYDFTEPLYTHPQPKREPLTESAIADIVIDMNGNEPTALFWRDLSRAIEAAHNIK